MIESRRGEGGLTPISKIINDIMDDLVERHYR